ncbi:MAG: hypothetical protein KKI08_20990, partial [Armatimonadetes bacterium]|nr:hypothetical protein [Armatimonadota bacterium]
MTSHRERTSRRTYLMWGMLLLGALPAGAAVWNVPADYGTVQAAIDASVHGDEVVIAPGVYDERIRFNGKAITVRSANPQNPATVAATVLDGDAGGSVVTFANGEGAGSVLMGLTVRNGSGTLVGGSAYGGSVFCRGASPTIAGNRITGSRAYEGGGICVQYGSATIAGNTICGNSAVVGGGIGGVHVSPTISGNTIADNEAVGEQTGAGGGVYLAMAASEGVSIVGNNITGNTATSGYIGNGGGMYCYGGVQTIAGNVIAGNTASGNYGGIGGGISVRDSASVSLRGNVIVGNSALSDVHGEGGGLASDACTLEVIGNTLAGNTGTGSYLHIGGMWLRYGGPVRIRDTIIACSTGTGLHLATSDPPVLAYCNVHGSSTGNYVNMPDQTGLNGNISADPLFVNLAGGDVHLKSLGGHWNPLMGMWIPDPVTSPCVDAGDPASPFALEPMPNGGRVNMGAYGNTAEASRSYWPNRPPVAAAGEDRTVEADKTGGADVQLAGSATDPDGDPCTFAWSWTDAEGTAHTASGPAPTVFLELGVTAITLVVHDGQAASAPDVVAITVQDTTAPLVAALAADPDTLWPPNGKMAKVTLSYEASDVADPAPDVSLSVTCNERSFDPKKDVRIVDDTHLKLRAERDGKSKQGRIYTITVCATDASGNEGSATTTVTVPHDQGRARLAAVSAACAASTGAGAQITFSLSSEAEVSVTVSNIAGRVIRQIAVGPQEAGLQSVLWDTRNAAGVRAPAGLYLVQISACAGDGTVATA